MCGTRPSHRREHDRRRTDTAPFDRSGAILEPSNQFTARLPEWCDEAARVHWVQEADGPPSCAEAHRRLQGEGRRSRVSHPSETQRRL
jgi:hypothetical protein